MSTVKTNNVQVGQSVTAANNFTIYQPTTPDGTMRIGVGNSGATTSDAVTISSAGNVTAAGTVSATSFSGSGASLTGIAALSTATGSAPSYSARAWVNFNGSGTVAIRASGNVSSITDNGTGDYTLNFSTALADANYAVLSNHNSVGNAIVSAYVAGTPATGSVRLNCQAGTGFVDPTYVFASVSR